MMLILVDESCLDIETSVEFDKLFDKLIMSHFDQYHYIIISEIFLECAKVRNNPRWFSFVEECSKRYIEIASLGRLVDFYINIKASGTITRKNNIYNIEFEISAADFIGTSIYMPSAVIFEDYEDRHVYYYLAKRYIDAYSNVDMRLTPVNGGGSNTFRAIDLMCATIDRDSKMTACIFDSDIKFPNGGKGGTADKIVESSKKANVIYEKKMVETHEIENIIPSGVYAKVLPKPDANDIINLLDKVSIHKPELYRYIDIKLGIRTKKIKFTNNPEEAIFNREISLLIGKDQSDQESATNKCVCLNKDKCKCYVIAGISKALEYVNEYVIAETMSEKFRGMDGYLTPELAREWEKIGKFLASWTLASA